MSARHRQIFSSDRSTSAPTATLASLLAGCVMLIGASGGLGMLGGCSSTLREGSATNAVNVEGTRWLPPGEPVRLKMAAAVAETATANSALAYFNARRLEVGLPALHSDPEIARAAAEHARYLVRNDRFGHEQTQGLPGFTGSDVTARVRRHTQVDGASEVLSQSSVHQPAAEAFAQVFDAPFHRGLVLFDWTRAGAAIERSSRLMLVVDFADLGHAIANNELVAYPYAGQSNVPYAWTDDEMPDPMGPSSSYRGHQLGFPITLSGAVSAHVVLSSLVLTDAEGRRVKCWIAAADAADEAHNTAVCTPFEPLHPATRYTVYAQGHLLQPAATDTPFALTWSFTTEQLRASDLG